MQQQNKVVGNGYKGVLHAFIQRKVKVKWYFVCGIKSWEWVECNIKYQNSEKLSERACHSLCEKWKSNNIDHFNFF